MTGFGRPQQFRKLLVAPFEMRTRLVEEIRAVTAAAKAGEPARIRLKLNNLVDPTLIDELYAASQRGRAGRHLRPVDLHAPAGGRGALGEHPRPLDPGAVPRAQPHLLVRGGRRSVSMFIGSADLMPRNLDRRVEVLVPVENARARQELQAVLGSVFADDVHAWALASDGSWSPVEPAKAGEARRPPGGDDAARAAARAAADGRPRTRKSRR